MRVRRHARRRRRDADRKLATAPLHRAARQPAPYGAKVLQRRAGNRAVLRLVRKGSGYIAESGRAIPSSVKVELERLRSSGRSLRVEGTRPSGSNQVCAFPTEGTALVRRASQEEQSEEESEQSSANARIQLAINAAKASAKRLRQKLRQVTDRGERQRYLERIKSLEAFPTTHELPILSLQARVMRARRFLGPSVARLRRGETVEVLATQGVWYRVRTQQDIEGWLPNYHLIPVVAVLTSVKTSGGGRLGDELGARG